MSILSKDELLDLNLTMLGRGAPIEIDGTGYNKFDYSKMAFMASKTDISDNEAFVLASVLLKYIKTQLTTYSDKIKETVQHYQAQIKNVKVEGFNREAVRLSWNFNSTVSEFIKYTLDRKYFKWTRVNNNWVLEIKWVGIDALLDVFLANDLNITQVTMVRDNLDKFLGEETESEEPEEELILKVSRPSTSIDTLVLDIPYQAEVVNAFKSVPYSFFNKGTRDWEIYIEYSLVLYDAFQKLNLKGFDFSELKPWADLVKSWGGVYQMIDLSKCPLKFQPYDFQIEDIQKLLQLKVGLNANDMGCGKTFESVVVGESIPMKKLVICPPTLRLNWKIGRKKYFM